MWTFGVLEAGCFGAVDIATGKSYLFVPKLPASYAVWMGPLLTLDDFKKRYQVDVVNYVDDVSINCRKPYKTLLTLIILLYIDCQSFGRTCTNIAVDSGRFLERNKGIIN